jgi:hypothetical protein
MGEAGSGHRWDNPRAKKPSKGGAVTPPSFGGKKGQGTEYVRPNGTTYWSRFGPKSAQDKPVPKPTPKPTPTPPSEATEKLAKKVVKSKIGY